MLLTFSSSGKLYFTLLEPDFHFLPSTMIITAPIITAPIITGSIIITKTTGTIISVL